MAATTVKGEIVATGVSDCDIDEVLIPTGWYQSQKDLDVIAAIESADTVKKAVGILTQLENAKHAADAADEFRKMSVRYAMLEAITFVRLVELGGEKHIKPKQRREAAIWLHQLGGDRRMQYVEMCRDGLTIDQVWRREVEEPRKERQGIVSAKAYEQAAIQQFEEFGFVSISDFKDKLDKLPIDNRMKDNVRDGLRNHLRQRHAIGIGDGKGTYFNANNPVALQQGIALRCESIESDIMALLRLVETSGNSPVFRIDMRYDSSGDISVKDMVSIMLCYKGIAKVEFSSDKKTGQFLNRFIRAIDPDFYRSTELLDTIAKEGMLHNDSLSDKCGYISHYFSSKNEPAA